LDSMATNIRRCFFESSCEIAYSVYPGGCC
jgi:hypothetical protein